LTDEKDDDNDDDDGDCWKHKTGFLTVLTLFEKKRGKKKESKWVEMGIERRDTKK